MINSVSYEKYFLLQISTLLCLLLTTWASDELLINEDYGDEYSESTYLKSILNAILNLNNPFQGWQLSNSEDETYEELEEEFEDDSRFSRNLEIVILFQRSEIFD